jgi:hypothetical protein
MREGDAKHAVSRWRLWKRPESPWPSGREERRRRQDEVPDRFAANLRQDPLYARLFDLQDAGSLGHLDCYDDAWWVRYGPINA